MMDKLYLKIKNYINIQGIIRINNISCTVRILHACIYCTVVHTYVRTYTYMHIIYTCVHTSIKIVG